MDPYEENFIQRLHRIYPDADSSILPLLPEDAAHAVLKEILETGCLSGNDANIRIAREALSHVSAQWLFVHLPQVVPSCLFQEPEWQEWEFRRLAEMLREPFPRSFGWLLAYAEGLNNPEVDGAVLDMTGEP